MLCRSRICPSRFVFFFFFVFFFSVSFPFFSRRQGIDNDLQNKAKPKQTPTQGKSISYVLLGMFFRHSPSSICSPSASCGWRRGCCNWRGSWSWGGCCSGGWLAGEQPLEIKKEKEKRRLLVADEGREWVCCDWSCGFNG